ncbi:NAD(P)H-dependent glycerol-3-phosphate dehydrogenase [Labrys monachus]|uniref:Glycerol-3-phosphate dehydrogenase [NAD(P)+] n=1 Tax=Labrys monachus TaxID=217067 RepID=A0ABU0FNC4_9HYPH|nr:NAD(P)H-dependent glycerol-3-phosphate dehydrogenase [Labrys monachus]MDQ0395971.1 glycerol-3-phosphate dehydrogenase (NAD(P)+) [Labrys monachus]
MSAARGAVVGVIGAGAFGTALACALARAGCAVRLWGRDAAHMAELAQERRVPRLGGLILAETIRPTADLREAAAAEALVLAVPTQALRDVCLQLGGLAAPDMPLILAAKGIERRSGGFVSDIVRETLPSCVPAVLSGPGFAADIARGFPTALTLACADGALGAALARMIGSPAFRLYHTTDLRGVEIGGAAKNVLAIAAGVAAGRGFGESTVAALLARSFAELTRFGLAFGGRAETLAGLSGLGDLILTGTSSRSRNRRFGEELGRGAGVETAIAEVGLAEGVWTAPILARMAAEKGVDMPVAAAVADLVGEARVGIDAVIERLLARPPRAE